MGMAASQARMLSLTSRLSDLELKAQQIANTKIRLSDASSEASSAYNLALSKETLTVFTGINTDGSRTYANATLSNLLNSKASSTDKYRYIETSDGRAVVDSSIMNAFQNNPTSVDNFARQMLGLDANASLSSSKEAYSYYSKIFDKLTHDQYYDATPVQNNSDWLNSQVEAGLLYLYEWDKDSNDGKGDFVGKSWDSGDTSLVSKQDDHNEAKAEAEYNATMKDIEAKESRLDAELKKIDTEHNAVQTEIDSVKGVISKNIERSFKIFDA